MKRFTNVKSGGVILTLLLLALVSGSVWGQEVLKSGDFRKLSAYSYTADKEVVVGNDTWLVSTSQYNASVFYLGCNSKNAAKGLLSDKWADVIAAIKNQDASFKENTDHAYAMRLQLNGTSLSDVGHIQFDWAGSNDAMRMYLLVDEGDGLVLKNTLTSGSGPTVAGSISYEFAQPQSIKDIVLVAVPSSNSKTIRMSTYEITKAVATNKVATPTFEPIDGTTFDESLIVKATCATEGASIHYTTNGDEPTVDSDVLTEAGITITETTAVKAIAVKEGLDNSSVVTATYTKVEPFASLAELKEKGGATAAGVPCIMKLTDAVVTYADSRKAYIQDETAGLYVFGSNKLKAGTKLNGVVAAQLALYFGLYELKVDGGEFDNVAVTNDVEIPVQEVTVAELNQNFARYESMRVKVVDATVTSSFNDKNGEIEQNGEKIALRAADENITADVQATVDVTGYPGLYNSTKQLNVILQEDIAVKTAGKTQATLTFDSDAYSVNVGEFLTVKATTNSSASVIYSSSDKTIATVDENTGEVQAGNKAGTVTITATVTENDKYTGATATCTVNVVDPSALPEAKALVAEDKEGILHAMKNELGNTRLNAMEVYSLNGKIIDEGKADIKWYINIDNGTIQNIDGMYVVFEDANKADIKLSSKKGNSWYYKSEDGSWNTKETDGRFLGYNEQITAFRTYSSSTYPKAVAMPIVDGYIRSTTSGDYGTICLPYAVAAEDMAGAEFFSIAGKVLKDGEPQSIVLEQVTTLEAGVPYIFSATSDKLIAAYSGKAVAVAEEANGLIGSFEGQDVAEGMYLISAQNKVQLCGKGCKISGNRAYIDMNKVPEYSGEVGVNQRLISFEDATGISETMVEGGLADVYTLSGVEIRHQVNESEATQGLPQGIYIVNGKKVVVK
ncbi:chitobiase/beta-hexosaminidase C-terminal domain-containing protein [Paraprevotella clara]|uniref:chitobiase/beta-hexosaminidase C-terminal domain-containing protein n=1 Tax=Paraprevotella clara TaxID=454154 RepID=UPI003AB28964